MKNNFLRLLEDLAEGNSKHSPCPDKQREYDALLRDLQLHYLNELSVLPKGRLLDYGGAYGTQSLAFSALGHKVTMMDNMPELSNQDYLGHEKVFFAKNNLETDPLPESEYDYAVFSEVLEHLCYNPARPLRKLYDALKPGGLILASTPMLELPVHRQACEGRYCNYLHYRDVPEPWNGYEFADAHHKLYSKKELVQLFHEVGFEVLECYPVRKGTHHFVKAAKPT